MSSRILHKNDPSVRLAPALELRFSGTPKAGEIEGYASVFGGQPDSYGDIIAPGAFRRSLAEMKAEDITPSMLWSHDPSQPIGRWTEMREDNHGLFVRGSLNLATSRGRDAHEHLKQGDVSGLSIGFLVAPNGKRKGDNNSTILTDIDLVEVSVVAFPANRRARINGVKSLQSKGELIELLREGGIPKAAAQRIAAGGWPALSGEDHQKTIDLAADIERATAEFRSK